MSLGSATYSATADQIYADIYANDNVLVVAAAGNGGSSAGIDSGHHYPASYGSVVAVAAIDEAGKRASFSQRQVNDQVEVAAPGRNVLSTVHRSDGTPPYDTYSGTSMACPHAAAVAAMVWTWYPDCTDVEMRNALARSAAHPSNKEMACDGGRYGSATDWSRPRTCTICCRPGAGPGELISQSA